MPTLFEKNGGLGDLGLPGGWGVGDTSFCMGALSQFLGTKKKFGFLLDDSPVSGSWVLSWQCETIPPLPEAGCAGHCLRAIPPLPEGGVRDDSPVA